MTGDDDRRRWIELHGVFNPQFHVVDEVTVDEVRRCPAVQRHGELRWVRSAEACREQVADAQ